MKLHPKLHISHSTLSWTKSQVCMRMFPTCHMVFDLQMLIFGLELEVGLCLLLYNSAPFSIFSLTKLLFIVFLCLLGTRTPLHFDSYDNLFVQLVGAKYVRLYDTDQTDKLYVSKDGNYGLQGNMSKVNCELEDFDSHPLAKTCQYTEVLLLPGDCLFIPSRHWHYVRSLSTSISINYWF